MEELKYPMYPNPYRRLVDMPKRLHSENWSRQEVYRQNIVLGLLVGKVVCSQCGHKLIPAPSNMMLWDQLVVTRWIGGDGDQLSVDLDCRMCGHGGIYQFPDNPLKVRGA